MSLRGYCRTDSERTDWMPATRMTRLTTTASTGRRMKRSVSFMSAVLRLRGRVVGGLDAVVDGHRGVRPQLEHARGDHLLAGLQPGEHGDLVAAGAAHAHDLLAHAAVDLPARPLHLLDDVDRVAV